MALTKEIAVNKIEILEDGQIQVRQVTRIKEDGIILSQSFQRHVVAPDKEDMSNEDVNVQSVAKVLWTQDVKDIYRAKLELLAAKG